MITFDELLKAAYENGASKLHITAGAPPRIRVNGELVDMKFPTLLAEDTYSVVTGIMGKSRKDEFLLTGDIKFAYESEGGIRCRVSAYKQQQKVGAVVKLVKKELKNPLAIGLPIEVINLYKKKSGLVLVFGPLGGGKSTAVAAILSLVNENRRGHILTAEESIEYTLEHNRCLITQREVGADTSSYATAIRYALKEDADVIYVEDFLSDGVIDLALSAAEGEKLFIAAASSKGIISGLHAVCEQICAADSKGQWARFSSVVDCIFSRKIVYDGEGKMTARYEVLECSDGIKKIIKEKRLSDLNDHIKRSSFTL